MEKRRSREDVASERVGRFLERRKVPLILVFVSGVCLMVAHCMKPKQKHAYDFRSLLTPQMLAHVDSKFEADADHMLLLEKISRMPPNQIGKNSGFPLWNLDQSGHFFLMLTDEDAFYIVLDEFGNKHVLVDFGRNGNLNALLYPDFDFILDIDGDFEVDGVSQGSKRVRALEKGSVSPEEQEMRERGGRAIKELGDKLEGILKDKVEGRSQREYELMV